MFPDLNIVTDTKECKCVKQNHNGLCSPTNCTSINQVRRIAKTMNCNNVVVVLLQRIGKKDEIIQYVVNIYQVDDLESKTCPSLNNHVLYEGGSCRYHSIHGISSEEGYIICNIEHLIS